MDHFSNYQRTVGLLTILAGLLSAACLLVGAIAVEFNFDAFSHPLLVLNYAHHYREAYWFLILDMFGYYLLLLPAIFYLHHRFKFHSPWVPLLTFCGVAYVLTGALGSAMLAATWPHMMQQYLGATGMDAEPIARLFEVATLTVTQGMWNLLEVVYAAVWWIGFGILMYRQYRWTATVGMLTGVACFIDHVGNLLAIGWLADAGLNLYLALSIVWPIMLGIRLMRGAGHRVARTMDPASERADTPALAPKPFYQ
ncbi:MAG TPA: hypothetical protein VK907_14085 [Phnomibacter sp.]|nr:hypothetical protein [Phnomibacter sp.]